MQNFIRNNKEKIYDKSIFFIETLIILILGINIFEVLCNITTIKGVFFKEYITIIITTIILLIILIFNTIRYKKNVQKLFVTYILPIGILFIILLPMNWVPDEEAHMAKTYEISQGKLITPFGENKEGDIYVPQQLLDIVNSKHDYSYVQIREDLKKEADYRNTAPIQTIAKTYFPLNYVSGAITFAVCRTFNMNLLLMCYVTRLVNFILFVIIAYYCIKTIPFGKLLLAIYMFLPMNIQQSASLSADVFINSISILFIVYNMKLLYQDKDVSLKQKIIYYVLALSISVCKYVYFILVFMSLLLIKNRNISKRNKIEMISISIIGAIIIAIGWFIFSQQYVDARPIIIERNVLPIQQIKYILSEPIKYIKIVISNITELGGFYINTFIGSSMGLLNIKIPEIYIILFEIGLAVLPFLEYNEKSFEKVEKGIVIAIAILAIILILTALYITWTPHQAQTILGVQGRYFIPIFILILLSMIKGNQNVEINHLEIKYFIMFFVLNLLTLVPIAKLFIK